MSKVRRRRMEERRGVVGQDRTVHFGYCSNLGEGSQAGACSVCIRKAPSSAADLVPLDQHLPGVPTPDTCSPSSFCRLCFTTVKFWRQVILERGKRFRSRILEACAEWPGLRGLQEGTIRTSTYLKQKQRECWSRLRPLQHFC